MKRITWFLAFLFLTVCAVNASNEPGKPKVDASKSMISGTVTDNITGEPLAGVEVKLMDSDVKLYTDLDGKFEIKDMQPGTHYVIINFISYQDLIENVQTEKGNVTDVTIKLKSIEK
jgi:hypothetical protein